MSLNKNQNTTISFDEFEPSHLAFSELVDNKNSKNNSIGWPKYKHPRLGNDSKLKIQLPWMELFTYGIPRQGEHYETDQKRAFIKIPLDSTNPDMNNVITKMTKLDTLIAGDDMKKTLFPGKKPDNYVYIPSVKVPVTDEEDDKMRPPHMKIRLNNTWPDIKILTKVFTSTTNENGETKRVEVTVNTLDELTQYVRYKCNYKAIIEPTNMWADKKPKMGLKQLQYGIIWKLVMIEVKPSENMRTTNTNTDFIDDDDEEAVVVAPPSKKVEPTKVETKKVETKKVETKKVETKVEVKKVVEEDEDDDEDEEDEEEEEEEEEEEPEPVPEPPKKGKGKVAAEKPKKK